MSLVGVGLIPESAILGALVDFSTMFQDEIGPPRLGRSVNIPHVSVHQIPVESASDFVDAVGEAQMPLISSVEIGDLVYQPVGWLFASVDRPAWLLDLQRSIVASVGQLVDRSSMKDAGQLDGYSAEETSSYLRHGYRYVGASYKPHFTVGRTDRLQLELSPACLEFYRRWLWGRTVRFDHAVAYLAGEHGSLAEVLAFL